MPQATILIVDDEPNIRTTMAAVLEREGYSVVTAANVGSALREIGQRQGRLPGQVAIAWALHNPAVTGAIVGSRSAEQVERNIGAAELYLTDEEIAEIEGRTTYQPELVMAV